jgi:hypothetical protein
MDKKPLPMHAPRPRWLAVLTVGALAAWLALAALPTEPVSTAVPGNATPAPARGSASLYPAPQVDASAPPAEPAPTF